MEKGRGTARWSLAAGPKLSLLHVARLVLVESIQRPRQLRAEDLDARDAMRIVLGIVWTTRRAARDLENALEIVAHRLPRLWIRPRAAPCERTILRPEPLRQRHGAHLVARSGGV